MSKFVTEGGVIKLVRDEYSISDKTPVNCLEKFTFEEALELRRQLREAIDNAKEHKRIFFEQSIIKSEQTIEEEANKIVKYSENIKSLNAIK